LLKKYVKINVAISACEFSQVDIGRTIRGVSGALYLQSAIARGNSFFEGYFGAVGHILLVLMSRSCAIKRREPRQAGNRAAISGFALCAAGMPALSRKI